MIKSRRLLLAQTQEPLDLGWERDIEASLNPSGVVVCHALSREETARRIEEGGLSAVVVMEQTPLPPSGADVFALLRIIRALDSELPCWLVTRFATRRAFEQAFELRVQSVIHYPSGVGDLLAGLRRLLQDPAEN